MEDEMSNTYTEGCVEFDIGAQGNQLLVSLHEEAVKMEEYGAFWRDMVPPASDVAQRFYVGLFGGETAADDITAEGTVKLSDGGVMLHGDEQFPDDYFLALVRFVLKELKLPNVVGWECSVRCDKQLPWAFGGFFVCVSARGLVRKGTHMGLFLAKEKLEASMKKYLAEGGEL